MAGRIGNTRGAALTRWLRGAALCAAAMVATGAPAAANAVAADPLVTVHDARLDPPLIEPSPADVRVLAREVRPVARATWGNAASCPDQFQPLAVATGAFTRKGVRERAVLYRYCPLGPNLGRNGIAVIAEGRVVAHVQYEGAPDHTIAALPDINRNGIAEILLVSGGTNRGDNWEIVAPIELGARGVTKFGRLATYTDDCPLGKDVPGVKAELLRARPGSPPAFVRETFTADDCERERRWTRKGKPMPVTLKKDEVDYRRVK